jgi:hypothetical protein
VTDVTIGLSLAEISGVHDTQNQQVKPQCMIGVQPHSRQTCFNYFPVFLYENSEMPVQQFVTALWRIFHLNVS